MLRTCRAGHFEKSRSYSSQTDGQLASSSNCRQALGSKKSASRSTSNVAFAQSIRDRNLHQPAKKFKTSDPRGTKIASGFVDRVRERAAATPSEQDTRAEQIADLEEQLKQKQISRSAFEASRDAITAGDISATHLVKGLDRKLLERIRNGENVMDAGQRHAAKSGEEENDIDDELEKLESAEVTQMQKRESLKQGDLAPSVIAGRKRTRDEIMAEMKAQRKAALDAGANAEPHLDHRWRSVSEKQRSRVEVDRKGREVLVIVDEDGIVKKKLRRPAQAEPRPDEQVIGRNLPGDVVGADIVLPTTSDATSIRTQEIEDHDEDIFEGVGTEYDPLGHGESDFTNDTDHDSVDEPDGSAMPRRDTTETFDNAKKTASDLQPDSKPPRPRNYFNDKSAPEDARKTDHFSGVEAVIAKAAKLASKNEETSTEKDDHAARLRRDKYAAMLDTRDRDMDDMDLGFGASRYEDHDEEDGGKKVHLSRWSDEREEQKGGDKKNKKAPSKRRPRKD